MQQELWLLTNAVTLAAVLFSIVLHEIGHGWVAYRCGDPTAKLQGRLTLNPLPHLDPVMSVIVPLITYFSAGFVMGSAKPVPVNPNRLRVWPRDFVLVSLAGVAVNLLIATACALLLHAIVAVGRTGSVATVVLLKTFLANIGLMLFNLVPVPPLDGSKALAHLLPSTSAREWFRRLELQIGPYGMLIAAFLVSNPPFDYLFHGLRAVLVQLFLPDELTRYLR